MSVFGHFQSLYNDFQSANQDGKIDLYELVDLTGKLFKATSQAIFAINSKSELEQLGHDLEIFFSLILSRVDIPRVPKFIEKPIIDYATSFIPSLIQQIADWVEDDRVSVTTAQAEMRVACDTSRIAA